MQYNLCNGLIEAVSTNKKHLEHLKLTLWSHYPLNNMIEFQQHIAHFKKLEQLSSLKFSVYSDSFPSLMPLMR